MAGIEKEMPIVPLAFIAKVCWQAVKALDDLYNNTNPPMLDWEETTEPNRQGCIQRVMDRINNPCIKSPGKYYHSLIVSSLKRDGYVYGETRDAQKKTDPIIVRYKELSDLMIQKSNVFYAIVDALRKKTH